MNYLVVFLGGVAVSFTPCIYPLIPIIIGVISANQNKSHWRNFILSLSYVLGMALTFSILGLIAAITGRLFGQLQSSSLAHLIVGAIIILFGLALLDVILLPTSFLYKLGLGHINKKRGAFGVFLMGIASGFVASPCTAAVLGAVLTYVATKQNILFGFSLLFVFAIGLGTLLLIVGTFAGALANLPKAQKWTKLMQKILAFFMIALGAYFIFKAGVLSV